MAFAGQVLCLGCTAEGMTALVGMVLCGWDQAVVAVGC